MKNIVAVGQCPADVAFRFASIMPHGIKASAIGFSYDCPRGRQISVTFGNAIGDNPNDC